MGRSLHWSFLRLPRRFLGGRFDIFFAGCGVDCPTIQNHRETVAGSMEDLLLYLVATGWAAMFMLPSLLGSAFVASIIGALAAILVQFNSNEPGRVLPDLAWDQFVVVGPLVVFIVFAAWPIGALFRMFGAGHKRAGA